MSIIRVISIVLVGLLITQIAEAEDRALIIGIGHAYRDYGINGIDGPERDVELAKEIAGQMGYSGKMIKVIQESAATKRAILEGFEWLKHGLKNGGKGFLYYSGHGTQVKDEDGDESDGCDEAIVPVDAKKKGCILDDDINRFIKDGGNTQVALIIDSCCSGTITRSISLDLEERY